MTLRYNGRQSVRHFLPASRPQGVYLGVLIFLVKFNGAFLRPLIPKNLLTDADKQCHDRHHTAKYVDDSCKAVAVNLKKCLVAVEPKVRPVTYSQRTGHQLSDSHNQMQGHLENFDEFIAANQFRINHKKSFLMKFNISHKFDFDTDFI